MWRGTRRAGSGGTLVGEGVCRLGVGLCQLRPQIGDFSLVPSAVVLESGQCLARFGLLGFLGLQIGLKPVDASLMCVIGVKEGIDRGLIRNLASCQFDYLDEGLLGKIVDHQGLLHGVEALGRLAQGLLRVCELSSKVLRLLSRLLGRRRCRGW